MLVGTPKEIKNHEYRVGLTPASVRELTARVRQLRSQVSDLLSSEFKTLPYKRFNC